MSKTRVLIVDDSKTMQHIVRQTLQADAEIEVVGAAGSAIAARQMIKDFNPDVITLDVEMPDMNGIEFLERIMKLRPMPVVMVSSVTAKGSETAVEALSLGAVDCVVKPTPQAPESFADLALRVKSAAKAKVQAQEQPMPARTSSKSPGAAATSESPVVPKDYKPSNALVAIGSSTGGVEALQVILTRLPANCPPVLITQHMPPTFTKTLARRLSKICAPKIEEATDGAACKPGVVYIAPGGEQHLEIVGRSTYQCRLKSGPRVNGHCPSVDVLFESVAHHAGSNAVGVILTGMGNDGAAGLLKMRQAGARTIGQNEATCVVYGMPKVAQQMGAVGVQRPIGQIAEEIMGMTNANLKGAA